MAELRVSYETLEQQGNDLTNFGEELLEIVNKIDSKINDINASWDGLAQDAYIAMYDGLKETINQFPELIKSIGGAAVGAANAYRGVDEELKNSFSNA